MTKINTFQIGILIALTLLMSMVMFFFNFHSHGSFYHYVRSDIVGWLYITFLVMFLSSLIVCISSILFPKNKKILDGISIGISSISALWSVTFFVLTFVLFTMNRSAGSSLGAGYFILFIFTAILYSYMIVSVIKRIKSAN